NKNVNMCYKGIKRSEMEGDSDFSGKRIVLRGKVEEMRRNEGCEWLKMEGGKVRKSVSKSSDIVIGGGDGGCKLGKGEKYGSEIWSEGAFIEKENGM
ncbi:BRCT domain-containing protein, partial [Staphylococcus epidermidis]|uniref:BRCT domain-containing protein n=1 Tax=Staphylococcus epidermidis TaxID=1282 RepID=UPI0028CB2102